MLAIESVIADPRAYLAACSLREGSCLKRAVVNRTVNLSLQHVLIPKSLRTCITHAMKRCHAEHSGEKRMRLPKPDARFVCFASLSHTFIHTHAHLFLDVLKSIQNRIDSHNTRYPTPERPDRSIDHTRSARRSTQRPLGPAGNKGR